MRKAAPIKLRVYCPADEQGRQMLAQRVSEVHADVVKAGIEELECPLEQKLALVDAILADMRSGTEQASAHRRSRRADALSGLCLPRLRENSK